MEDYIIDNETGELIEYKGNQVITDELINIIDEYFMAKERYDEAVLKNKEAITEFVKANGELTDSEKSKKFKTRFYNFLVTFATTSTKFDTTAFKKDEPELYEKYLKKSPVKESLKITPREY